MFNTPAEKTATAVTGKSFRAQYAMVLFAVVCLAYLFVTFHRVTPNILAVDLSRDLGMDAVTIGWMSSVFFFTYGLMQLPAGMFADSLGPRKTVPIFFAMAGAACIAFGMASSVWPLLIDRALMGIGVSVVSACGVKLLTQWFAPDKFASMNGMLMGMGGAGLILGSGPLAQSCAELGWRLAMVSTGVITVAIAALFFILVYDKPEDRGFEPIVRTKASKKKISAGQIMKANIIRICSSWQFWLIAVWFCCHFSMHMAFGGVWGGPFLMDVHGMTQIEAGNVINMMGVGMLLGGPFNGWLSDKVFHGRRPVMIINSFMMLIVFGVLALFGEHFPVWASCLWFFSLAVFGMGALCTGFASMKDLFGVGATGTASGLLNGFPSIAVALMQPLTGAVLEWAGRTPEGAFTAQGFSYACILYLGLAAIGLIAALCAGEPMKAAPVEEDEEEQAAAAPEAAQAPAPAPAPTAALAQASALAPVSLMQGVGSVGTAASEKVAQPVTADQPQEAGQAAQAAQAAQEPENDK